MSHPRRSVRRMDTEVRGLESMLDSIVRGRRELDAIEAKWLFMVGGYARSGALRADGYMSTAAAIRHRCFMNAGAARAAVRLAKTLPRLPATQKAFDAGAISRAHASVMADAYTEERAEKLAHIEEALVEFAPGVDPTSLRAAVGQYTDAIDGGNGAGNDEAAYAKNRFHASLVGDRVRGDLSLDPEAGEIVSEADHPELIADIRVEGGRYGRLSRTTLERLSCDCNIDRVITNGDGLSSTWVARRAISPARCGERSSLATVIAPNPAAPSRAASAKRTTSGIGRTADPPTSTI